MSNSDSSLVDLKHLGLSLKAIRERKNISLDQVAEATRIKTSYLQAIDSEEYEILPRGPYEAAFIKAYADYLGLQGSEFAQVYQVKFRSKTSPLAYRRILTQSRYNRSSTRAWISLFLLLTLVLSYGLVYFFLSDAAALPAATPGASALLPS